MRSYGRIRSPQRPHRKPRAQIQTVPVRTLIGRELIPQGLGWTRSEGVPVEGSAHRKKLPRNSQR